MFDENEDLRAENTKLKGEVNQWKKLYNGIKATLEDFKEKQREFKEPVQDFLEAVAHAPQKVCGFIDKILHEKHEQEAQAEAEQLAKKQSFDLELQKILET